MILETTKEDDGYQVDTKEIPRIQQALENLRNTPVGRPYGQSIPSGAGCFGVANEACFPAATGPSPAESGEISRNT